MGHDSSTGSSTASTSSIEAALAYVDEHQQRFLDDLFDLLRIPSISTLPKSVAKNIAGSGQVIHPSRWRRRA